jgi:DNA excision repair protein ERCC-5
LVYVDELEQTTEERKQAEQQRKRKFKRTDQYQLPQMDYDFSELGVPNDVRMLSAEELQEYAKQFEGMEDTNLHHSLRHFRTLIDTVFSVRHECVQG